MKKWKVSVCGSALTDHLYTNIDFNSGNLTPFLSKQDGDGGFSPGKLVFAEDLELFSGVQYADIIKNITGGCAPAATNLGGPAIVGAINAAQILCHGEAEFCFYGVRGDDESGKIVEEIVRKTPLNINNYSVVPGELTSCTDVMSDPKANNGKGERSFLYQLGASAHMRPENLDENFFSSEVTWYSATALVPPLHDKLTTLLRTSKENGSINIVSTVFDFRNEKKDPVGRWPLGESIETYKLTDLLIADCEEALRLSGKKTLKESFEFFRENGVSALFVTYGAKNFLVWSDGSLFVKTGPDAISLPVSALVDEDLAAHPERRGDTTGCGDNFAGGVVSSLVRQLQSGVRRGELSILDAAAWGAASGGAALFQLGGTYVEKIYGEKYQILKRYADAYMKDSDVLSTGIR